MLNPPQILPPLPPKSKLKEQIKLTKADKEVMLAELLMVCNDHIKNLKLKPEEVKSFDVAGTVQDSIKILAMQETLALKEKLLKSKFPLIFELIPHTDELP